MLVFLRDATYALPLAFVIMIVYELALVEYGLEEYIFYAPREDFVSANREGIASLVGYLSLNLIGIGIGDLTYRMVMTRD